MLYELWNHGVRAGKRLQLQLGIPELGVLHAVCEFPSIVCLIWIIYYVIVNIK